MRFSDWATRIMFIFLMFAALILALYVGRITQVQGNIKISNPAVISSNQYPKLEFQSEKTPASKSQNVAKSAVKKSQPVGIYKTTAAFAKYRPQYEVSPIDPSNYGERYTTDINGIPLNNQPIIVLHETSNSASSAINFFRTPHDNENIQASYHTLIKQDGTVVYLIPPDKRAFGAGNSVFDGAYGQETVKTNPNLPPSVNNFAYHVSLETPPDGWGDNHQTSHSGYTNSQYSSLAWLIAQSQVPDQRITTHRAVDRSGQRVDPLSFDFNKFFNLLHSFREVRGINSIKKP